ncbi:hypothetical protein MARSALSMR5_01850 [Marinobacter salarius]|uniref:Uncharacterized protein n=1 Tax=Marinobacter salarius TaxID=1420917 RepID=A0A1W6K929_9GAMM|nr:hypothetical protein MARSALSMR5_01850 [Marinobacter salarius]
MILNKSDTCRYCGGVKLIRWALVDYRQMPWSEWRPPGDIPANNELQRSEAINCACCECGLVYDFESLQTPVQQ